MGNMQAKAHPGRIFSTGMTRRGGGGLGRGSRFEEALEEASVIRGRRLRLRLLGALHASAGVGLGTKVGVGVLAVARLRFLDGGFVVGAFLFGVYGHGRGVLIIGKFFDGLKGMIAVCRRELGDFHFVIALLHGDALLEDVLRDGRRDAASMLAALHHDGDGIAGMFKGCKTTEPGDVFLNSRGPPTGRCRSCLRRRRF